MRLSPPLVVALVLSLLSGCRRGADEGGSSTTVPAVVRIADRLAEAEVTAAVDLADDRASLLADATMLLDATWSADLPAFSSHEGAWVDEVHPGRGPLRLAWAPVEPSQRALHVRVDAPFEPDDVAFLVPVPLRNEAAAYRDPAHAEKIVRYLRALAIPLAPRAGSDDPSRELVTTLAPDVREVLVAVRGAAIADPEATVRVAALGPRGAWLGRAARDVRSPWIRSVAVDQVTRPSIVLPTPGRLAVPVRVPSGEAPTLRFHVARFFGPEAEVRVAYGLGVGDAAVEGELRLPRGGGWREVEVDVARLGSGDGRFTLEVEGAAGAVVAVGAPRIEAVPLSPAPDVLLISLDTVRADHLSIHGAPAENSPSLARFADSAAVFEQAIAPAPWTLPSHASLFTGQQPDRHDVHRELSAVPRDLPWLVEDFRRAGYRTEAWTGGGYLDPTFGFDRGFDRYGTIDPAFPGRAWAARRGDPAEIRRAEASARSRRELLDRIAAPSEVPTFRFVHTYAAHEYAAD
ncbi:MAG: sulfatase-like hydrolase/transferase, partial [Planctomycetota bacterium JB042]